MNVLRGERGVALVAALGILLVALPLGALAVWYSRVQQLMARNARDDIEGLYAAEGALVRAVAAVPAGVGIDSLLAGPDGVSGSADDGAFPFAHLLGTGDESLPAAVVLEPGADGLVRMRVSLRTPAGRETRVEALVRRARAPFTPATVHVDGDWWGERTPGDLRIDGADHRLGDPPDAPSGPDRPRPALSATGPAERTGGGAGGGGSSGFGAAALPLGLPALVRDLLHEPGGVRPGFPLEGALVCGTRESPQLTILSGDVEVTESLDGAGILVVDGTLSIRGSLGFTGLLLVRDGIRFDPAARLDVAGALWTGVATGVELRGSGRLVYSSEALAEADAVVAGRLPRAPIVVGWREVF